MQHEITREIPLLNEKGDLTEPGFARRLLPVYRRADVKASPLRLKEWDYYCVSNGKIALCLTIADNGYMGLDSVSLIHLEEGWEITTSPMQILTRGKKNLPETSVFNLYAEHIMRNAGLDELQPGIKIAGRNINNLRYADDLTLMKESEE